MSTSGAASSGGASTDDKKSNKLFNRLSRAFSRKGRKSVSSIGEVIASSSSTDTKPADSKSIEPLKPVAEKKEPRRNRPIPPKPAPVSSAERAKALFKRHGLDINPADWNFSTVPPPTERVHKEIRMRVHRNCHKCDTPFGGEKTCCKCGHKRCKACPRFPAKKKDKKEKKEDKYKGRLTIPSKTGGQDLIRRPIRMRVRRTCHRCATVFTHGNKTCVKCKHTRCRDCPRDPKKNKPPGYYDHQDPCDDDVFYPPGRPRRTYKKPRRRVHWTCGKCSTTFKGNKICVKCGSARDEHGIRDPPKKDKKEKNYKPASGIAGLTQQLASAVI